MTRERAARSCRFARAGATGETWMPLRCTHDQNLVARASAIGETWMLLRCTHGRNLVARASASARPGCCSDARTTKTLSRAQARLCLGHPSQDENSRRGYLNGRRAHLDSRRRTRDPVDAPRRARGRGLSRVGGRQRGRRAALLRRRAARPDLPRHLDGAHGRPRDARRDQADAPRGARGHDLRSRHGRDGRQGDAPGRLRLRREAAVAREDPGHGQSRGRARPPRARERRAARGLRAARRDRRRERGDPRAVRADRDRRAHHRPRADPRRERQRQGAGGAGHSRAVRAARARLRRGQLRRHPRGADRVRAVRPREGRVHRCPRAAARSSSTRSAT